MRRSAVGRKRSSVQCRRFSAEARARVGCRLHIIIIKPRLLYETGHSARQNRSRSSRPAYQRPYKASFVRVVNFTHHPFPPPLAVRCTDACSPPRRRVRSRRFGIRHAGCHDLSSRYNPTADRCHPPRPRTRAFRSIDHSSQTCSRSGGPFCDARPFGKSELDYRPRPDNSKLQNATAALLHWKT